MQNVTKGTDSITNTWISHSEREVVDLHNAGMPGFSRPKPHATARSPHPGDDTAPWWPFVHMCWNWPGGLRRGSQVAYVVFTSARWSFRLQRLLCWSLSVHFPFRISFKSEVWFGPLYIFSHRVRGFLSLREWEESDYDRCDIYADSVLAIISVSVSIRVFCLFVYELHFLLCTHSDEFCCIPCKCFWAFLGMKLHKINLTLFEAFFK